jgi:hypothetical protein
VWAASFGAAFVVSLESIVGNEKHQRYWGDTFMPTAPGAAAGWLKAAMLGVFGNPVGLTPAWLALAVFALGCAYLVYANRVHAAILLAPLLLCLVASGLRKYPFGDRLLLFLVPALVLGVTKGVEAVAAVRRPAGPALAGALATALLFQPAVGAARALRHPRTHEELKPVLAYVRDRRRPGDAIYLYYASQYPMQYYAPRYGFAEGDYVLGKIARRNPEKYREQIDALRGRPRVWVVISHPTQRRGVDEQRYVLDYLDEIGTRLDEVTAPGAGAYLYDLSEKEDPRGTL